VTPSFASLDQGIYLIFPFAVSFVIEILSPITSNYWERKIKNYAEHVEAPDQVSDAFIDVSEHAFLLPQMTTAYFLTLASGGLILIHNLRVWIPVVILMIATGLLAVRLQTDDSFREPILFSYSRSSIYGIVLNISYTSVILFYHLCGKIMPP
jgi:hypothetical protein